MSVASINQQKLYKQLQIQTKQYIKKQLTNCKSYFFELLNKTIIYYQTEIQKNNIEKQNLGKSINLLNRQILKVKEDNSKIRNQYMTSYLQCQQLKTKNQQLILNHLKQQQKIKYISSEVQQFKKSLKQHTYSDQQIQKKTSIDFDDDDQQFIIGNKFQGLQVIKQVSQHDLSCSMSLQSYNSQMSQLQKQENPQPVTLIINQNIKSDSLSNININSNVNSNESSKINLNSIDNYLDALDFLKNYNTASNDKFMKKVSTAGIETTCRSNISSDQFSIIYEKEQVKENIDFISQNKKQIQINKVKDSQKKKSGRDIIDRIKKMRKIDDNIQQNQIVQDQSVSQPPLQTMHINIPKNNKVPKIKVKIPQSTSKDENIFSQNMQDLRERQSQLKKESARSSISQCQTNRYTSRIKQQDNISLDSFINKAFNNLRQINQNLKRYQKIIEKNGKSIIMDYGHDYQYKGNYNQNILPHGYGKLLLKNQCVYHGQWKNGNFHGWGKLILIPFVSSKEKQIIQIDGYFKNGIIEGAVICIFSNGQKFMGNIKKGQIIQQGTYVSQKQVYTGYWQNNKLQYRL